MKQQENRIGSCLCGAVKVLIQKQSNDLGVCHCPKCMKWAGGPFMELECGSNVHFDGEEMISTFKSSEWAIRGFCSGCGSHLFIKDERSGDFGIPPGLFDDYEGIELKRQVFFDKKPAYYSFKEPTRNITSEYIYKHFPEVKEN